MKLKEIHLNIIFGVAVPVAMLGAFFFHGAWLHALIAISAAGAILKITRYSCDGFDVVAAVLFSGMLLTGIIDASSWYAIISGALVSSYVALVILRIAIIDFGGFLWFFRALCLNSIAVVLAFLANNEIYIWAIAGYLGLFFASSIRKFFVVITRSHVFEAATSIIYWYIILIADILVIICLFGGIHRLLGVRLADGKISHEVADALLL